MSSATMRTALDRVTVFFPEWVDSGDGRRLPKWAVRLDGRTVQHCEDWRQARAYERLLLDAIAAEADGQACFL